ncbi:Rpn family recombination-promoting nuclease/putative transposase [Aneurinibacillus aneurinilyticus]|jgi:predicted transposase/invertase (TIGR01784 family)|uniref:Transposase (putative) YhgA-like domain-containing protein n=2 Tax=Aneurinibacillus aneurinilyticus TaxID=1391 RepID=U1WXY6_ANEAE|nr:Rpn family recombination-promoting nuclease/putative transposase [Aneurinibacillus aneurinilyticus]ERI07113.1 hypothetical protein HMPREF0083_04818 [Aneurinibacillus aneurinilyticus ATCC 12856]MCI1694712.1 Rpn family recombination-promoting nuclease/putative transposase [Aneurinibacillus aneurinilyticus]MED0706431.1 Rpn family recombination-promoting nuclease/putative transposase [Aneurinibacillus aneurinilyticus]MED0723705.1 Rpn family recombination-promoting nuclease/putative transposase [
MTRNPSLHKHQPHDKGYKYLLSSKKVFVDLLRSFVKQGWIEQIDDTNVIKVDKSYILQDFADKEADLVYRVKIKEQEVIFYVLLEMQSSVDFQMPFRLLLYMVEIWRDVLKNTGKNEAARKDFRLPVIVPIVLYNGKQEWTVAQTYKETLNMHELFSDQVLDFSYILLDVNRYTEKELLQVTNVIGTVFLLDQHVDDRELRARLGKLVYTLKQLSPEEFQLFRSWLLHIFVERVPYELQDQTRKAIEQTREGEVEMMMHNLERTLDDMIEKAEARGEAKGKVEGKLEVVKNLLRLGITDIEKLAQAANLPKEEIEKLLH